MPFAAARIIPFGNALRPSLRYVMPLKDTAWYRHHRDGRNHTEGDSLKYVDWNDVNATVDLIWNTTKFWTIDPNCWFASTPVVQALHSPGNNNIDPDYVKVSYSVATSMPEDHVVVKAVLFPKAKLFHPLYPIRYRYRAEKSYTITHEQGVTDSINITLPKNAPTGYYRLHLYLLNSTGDVILGTIYGIGLAMLIEAHNIIVKCLHETNV